MNAVWRTVVVAGAMLGTAHADPGPSNPPPKSSPVDQKSPAKPGDKPVDKAPAEEAPPSKDPAKPPTKDKPVDKKSPPKKPDARPRGTDDRPAGRGFVLA